jgi:secreted PhoX family phosphatase
MKQPRLLARRPIRGVLRAVDRRTIALLAATAAVAIGFSTASATAGSPGLVFTSSGGANNVTAYPVNAKGDAKPSVNIGDGIHSAAGLAFDSAGDLWAANSGSNSVVEFPKGELGKASPTPTVKLSSDHSGSIKTPAGLAFDSSGDLWVANATGDVEFSKSQLARSGSPTPAVTITTDLPLKVYQGAGLAFDSSGDLWVATFMAGKVLEYAKGQLARSGKPAPKVTISASQSQLSSGYATGDVAFDAAGDLWVPDPAGADIVEYTRSEIATSGIHTPKVTITRELAGLPSLMGPAGITFDSSGDLWVANSGGNTLSEFGKSQLSKSGEPTPLRIIGGFNTNLNGPLGIALEP